MSKRTVRTGRVLSGLTIAFLVFDAAIKLANIPAVLAASERGGIPAHLLPGIGVLLLACVALYAWPRTAPLGAVLLTGYLGGAILAHVRISDPLFTHTLFPVYVGALLWAGLFLRDERVRQLMAVRPA